MDYDRYWDEHPHPSAGPVAWRSPHHGVPDPVFAEACDVAESQALTVHLSVSEQLLGREDTGRRLLHSVALCEPDGTALTTVHISPMSDLRSIGERLLARLHGGAV